MLRNGRIRFDPYVEGAPMVTPRWMPWAGLASILGGLTALLLTPAFATAYFLAYAEYDPAPFWMAAVEPRLGSLVTFSSPDGVYETYGRIYDLVYVLFLPAVFGLHEFHQGSGIRMEKRGFSLLVTGLLAAFVGVAGDYWANGIGFAIEVLGLLIMIIGATTYGIAVLRTKVVPRWCAWLLVSCGPGALAFTAVIGHIPSGPTFFFGVSWLIVGFMLLFKTAIRPLAPDTETP